MNSTCMLQEISFNCLFVFNLIKHIIPVSLLDNMLSCNPKYLQKRPNFMTITSLESTERKVLDLAAWRGSFLVGMQMACSARLTYSPSLLSESFLYFSEGDAVSERFECVASCELGLHCSGFSMRRWLVLLWGINGTVINLAPHRNTSTIYGHSYTCAAAKGLHLIILNASELNCGMWLVWWKCVSVLLYGRGFGRISDLI